MSIVRKMVSLKEDDARFIEENAISLTKFVRTNLKKFQEAHSFQDQASRSSQLEEVI